MYFTNSISETHEHFSMPLGEAVALSLAPVKEKNTKTHGGPRTFQRLSGYNRGIFPIIGSAVLPATIGHLDPKSHGDANQVTITKGKDFELHQSR
jgi:hypothetical protein